MDFRTFVDAYIQESIEDGGVPLAEGLLQEIEAAGQQPGPRSGGTPGPQGRKRCTTFSDASPPPSFSGASKGRKIPSARFSHQNRAAPPARFSGAMEAADENVVAAVLADLEALRDEDGLAEARGVGKLSRVTARAIGGAARKIGRAARRPAVATTAGTLAGFGAAGYARRKESRAAKRGDVKATKKWGRARRAATAAATVLPVGLAATKAARYGGRQLQAAKTARWGKSARLGHKIKAAAGTTAAAALGVHGVSAARKRLKKGDVRTEKQLRRARKRKRAASAR